MSSSTKKSDRGESAGFWNGCPIVRFVTEVEHAA